MNATWITLAVVTIVGVTKLATYLLGNKRKIKKLQKQLQEMEAKYEQALAKNDTVTMSFLDVDMRRVRQKIASLKK